VSSAGMAGGSSYQNASPPAHTFKVVFLRREPERD
jgi:hypothetical protein